MILISTLGKVPGKATVIVFNSLLQHPNEINGKARNSSFWLHPTAHHSCVVSDMATPDTSGQQA
jgi:hypothetical protein